MQLPDICHELADWARLQAIDCQLGGNDNYANKFLQIEKLLTLIPAYAAIDDKAREIITRYQAQVLELQTEVQRLQTQARY